MSQRFKLDAREIIINKKAIRLEDLLDDDEEKDLKENVGENVNNPEEKGKGEPLDLSQLESDALTPARPFPGSPKPLSEEVKEDYAPMSAEEIAKIRKTHEDKLVGKMEQEVKDIKDPEKRKEGPLALSPSFRQVMKELLKNDLSPEDKKIQHLKEKYGDPEEIQSTIDILKEFGGASLKDVDIETAKSVIERADLPQILKERAHNLFDAPSRSDLIKSEQLALNSLKAIKRKDVDAATEWLHDTPEGRQYLRKIVDRYKIDRVLAMLSNTILTMEGQQVIDQPKQTLPSKGQRKEKTRIKELFDALQADRISNSDFEKAKRRGWTLEELIAERHKPQHENRAQQIEREYHEKERQENDARKKGEARIKLNMHKAHIKLNMDKTAEGDTTGPGGDSWEYEWTSGPTPTKDELQKRKYRFPFYNKPSGYTPGEGDQGNLHDIGPQGGQSDMNYLANVVKTMQKTADNDLFSIYTFNNGEKWLTYTLFKKAYSKFRSGDIVVQYGKTAADCRTYRRRFGSIKKAEKSIMDVLEPILATIVGQPIADDTLNDLQKGKGEPGGSYGPHTSPYDKQPEQGNRDGFDAKNPPRQRTNRKFIPHMDQPNDESSGLLSGSPMSNNNKQKK